MYSTIYWFLKALLRGVIEWAPFEAFNTLCLVLPARLIRYGLERYGATIGQTSQLSRPLFLHNCDDRALEPCRNLKIGNDCYLGRNVFLDLKDEIIIEDHACIAMEAMILTHTDLHRSPLAQSYLRSTRAPVKIGRGAYLGARCIVLQGVEIGESAVVGAGALVKSSIAPFTVWAGVPARQVGEVPRR